MFYEYLSSVRKSIQPNVNFKVHTEMEEIVYFLCFKRLFFFFYSLYHWLRIN